MALFGSDALAGTLRRLESGVRARCLNVGRVCTHRRAAHGLFLTHPYLSRCPGARRCSPHAGRRRRFPFRRNLMFSIVVGYGVGTLFATGLLLVMQLIEDFRDA